VSYGVALRQNAFCCNTRCLRNRPHVPASARRNENAGTMPCQFLGRPEAPLRQGATKKERCPVIGNPARHVNTSPKWKGSSTSPSSTVFGAEDVDRSKHPGSAHLPGRHAEANSRMTAGVFTR
jgi:hypothetical protein